MHHPDYAITINQNNTENSVAAINENIIQNKLRHKTLVALASSNNYMHKSQSYMHPNVTLVLYTPMDTSRGNLFVWK